MNEHEFGRLLRRIVIRTAPLPLVGVACGGTMTGTAEGGAGEHTLAGSSNGGTETGGSGVGGTGVGGTGAGGSGAGGTGVGGTGAGGTEIDPGVAGTGVGGDTCRGANAGHAPSTPTVPRACIGTADTTPGSALPRAAMLRISRDETRHAALSWQVQRWLDSRLDPAARARIATARHEAAWQLLQAVESEATPAFAGRIGLPDAGHTPILAAELASQLWS